MRKFKTIMVEVVDEGKFKDVWGEWYNSFSTDSEMGGCKVLAMSHEDEFSKIEEYEDKYGL